MKRPKSEVEFDLVRLRKLKRLTKRVLRGLEEIERDVVKFRRDRQGKPSDEAKKIAVEMYSTARQHRDGDVACGRRWQCACVACRAVREQGEEEGGLDA